MNDFNTINVVLDFLVPVLLLYYGYKARFRTPPFGDANGISTKRARKSEAEWAEANRFGGLLCLIFGGAMAVLLAVKYALNGFGAAGVWDYIVVAAGLLCVVVLLPLVNLRLKKVFGPAK